jgi:hypothetical protein
MSTLDNIILPLATADTYQNGRSSIYAETAGQGGEQFGRLMARVMSNPTGDKSLVASQDLNLRKIDAENSRVCPNNLRPAIQTAYAPAPIATTSVEPNLQPRNKGTTAADQARNSCEQPNHSITGTLSQAAAVKEPMADQNSSRGSTGADNVAPPANDSQSGAQAAVAQAVGTNHSHADNSTDATKNAGRQPEINCATANPVNITAQILSPSVVAGAVNVIVASGLPVAGKAAGTMSNLSGARIGPELSTNIPGPAVSKNPPAPEANLKIQNDDQKKESSFSGIKPDAQNNAADAKTAAMTSMARQALSAANAELKGDSKAGEPNALKPADDSPPTGLPAKAGAETKFFLPAQCGIDGTPTAQQDGLMNNGGKSTKTAELTGKFLPGIVAVVASGNDLPVRADQMSAMATASSSSESNPAIATVSTAGPIENVAAEDLRSQALERMHDLVAVHALRLGDTETNSSLQVVIKPGAGTQMSLELRQRGDAVEAQATLQQGNFRHLSEHWPDLQQRLEQRGIRLAPLTNDGALANNSGSETSKQKQNQSGETMAEIAFAAPVSGTFARPAARVKSPAGWETWA